MDRQVRVHRGRMRQNQALALHIKGHNVPSIRKALGYASEAGVRNAIRKAAARQAAAPVEEARNTERLHLQFLRKQAVDVIIAPDPEVDDTKTRAIKVALEISQRMSGLMGLDSTSVENDENAVDLWFMEVAGVDPADRVEFTEDDDLDEEPEDLELDEEEEDFDG